MWQNQSLELLIDKIGKEKVEKLFKKKREGKVGCFQTFLGPSALSLASHKALKHITSSSSELPSFLKRYNAVGAVGYAYTYEGNPLKHVEFFSNNRCFKIRFRVSNVSTKDDAGSGIREAAIKFCDQNHDGPFDLLLYTGRYFLARDSNAFLDLLDFETRSHWKKACLSNPFLYQALVDGLRNAPSSYTKLSFYSQFCYTTTHLNKEKRLIKFRLIPLSRLREYISGDTLNKTQPHETGHLSKSEQLNPWAWERSEGKELGTDYLKQEFKNLLFLDDPISYLLQVQFGPLYLQEDFESRNPQMLWDEGEYLWKNVMKIELTTHLSSKVIRNTTFNPADNPKGIGFPSPISIKDPFSIQKVFVSLCTKIERKKITQICDSMKAPKDLNKVDYYIVVYSESLKENRPIPYVQIYITLLGQRCRSIPLLLDSYSRIGNWEKVKNFRKENFLVQCERLDTLLGVIVEVYYRHLTENWFLRSVEVREGSADQTPVVFPCYEVVENPIFLLPGEVHLLHNEDFQVSKKERDFQLKQRKFEYVWGIYNYYQNEVTNNIPKGSRPLPGCIANAVKIEKAPDRHKLRSLKYKGARWEVDPRLIDFFRDFRSNRALKRAHLAKISKKSRQFINKNKTSNKNKKHFRPDFLKYDFVDLVKEEKEEKHLLNRMNSLNLMKEIGWKENLRVYQRHMSLTEYNPYHIEKKNVASIISEDSIDALSFDYEDDVFESKPMKNKKKSFIKRTLNKGKKKKKCFYKLETKENVESRFPDGNPGDICRGVMDDQKFGLMFLVGSNPEIIERCFHLPRNFPVQDSHVQCLMENNLSLSEEIQNGRIYIADYKIFDQVSTVHHNADHRFISAPLILLYSKRDGSFVPIAIQLKQKPEAFNSIITPLDSPENWLHAKLWVRCADFHYQFAIAHLFNCHFLMEPFLMATMRCLPSNHPVYKILLPYFRYLLVFNMMMRQHILNENGPVDKFTSLGRKGFEEIMKKHWKDFNFQSLNPIKNCKARAVDNPDLLPGYLYRDDSSRLFECIMKCCLKLLQIHYPSMRDFEEDSELEEWLNEINSYGFSNNFNFFMKRPASSNIKPSAPKMDDIKKPEIFKNGSRSPSAPYLPISEEIKEFSSNLPKYSPPSYQEHHKHPLSASFHSESSFIYDEINFQKINEKNINKNNFKSKNYDKTDITSTLYNTENKENSSFIQKSLDRDSPSRITLPHSLEEIAELLACVIFTISCQHSATHSDALDFFGYIPDVPAMMKGRPVDKPPQVDSHYLATLLPDQYSEAYYASLLFILNNHKPDHNGLGEMDEVYFVDEESVSVLKEMKKNLRELTINHLSRNQKSKIMYDALVPKNISSSPEPLPQISTGTLNQLLSHLGPTFTLKSFLEQTHNTSRWHYVLDLCLSFPKYLEGRSVRGLFGPHEENFQPNFQALMTPISSLDYVDHKLKTQNHENLSKKISHEISSGSTAKEKRKLFAKNKRLLSN